MRSFLFACLMLSSAPKASACEMALVLAVDVSGSVDHREYLIQMEGLAHGLRDGAVSEALVALQAQVTLMQWTGSSRQRVTLGWRAMTDFEAVEALAASIDGNMRVWRNFSTAIGEALTTAIPLFDEVAQCSRRVIDLSGDGVSNEGIEPRDVKPALAEAGIIVNALAIEGAEDDLTGYFFENVIHGPGAFVTTADGFEDYPDRIRQKLLRELTKQTSSAKAP